MNYIANINNLINFYEKIYTGLTLESKPLLKGVITDLYKLKITPQKRRTLMKNKVRINKTVNLERD